MAKQAKLQPVKHKKHKFPKLHNATWPGVVGKGQPGTEPCISFDEMLELTVAAEVDGFRFDGVDIFLAPPHFDMDSGDTAIEELAEQVRRHGLEIGTLVAPIWGGTGGGSAMSPVEKPQFLSQVRKACHVAKTLRDMGVRPNGCVRIDTACGVVDWAAAPEENQKRIAETFNEACDIAVEYDEVLACEGEICWGGIHSWRRMKQILDMVDRPQTLGFQADMAHSMLYLLGCNAPEDRLLPENFDWNDTETLVRAYKRMTNSLRIWTVDLHIAQNDATVFGSGDHDKTGKHCLPNDPNGKLDIVKLAGMWLSDEDGLLKRFNHICWDGCMFPNEVMRNPQTWNDILATMVAVRDSYGWS